MVWKAGKVEATRCPIRIIRETGIEAVVMAASGLASMHLPYSGGLLEQPGLLLDACNTYLAEKDLMRPDPPLPPAAPAVRPPPRRRR